LTEAGHHLVGIEHGHQRRPGPDGRKLDPNLFGLNSHYTGPAVKQLCGRARGRDGFVPSQVDKEFS
jgi:hypothetical protein